MDEKELADQWEQQVQEDAAKPDEKPDEKKEAGPEDEKKEAGPENVKPVNFSPLKAAGTPFGTNNLDFILEVPLQISVHIGSTKMLIKDLLQLGQGSIIELSKIAGEPMDVLVNDRLIARGEVVVVNDKFGIRLTDIMSPSERVEQLS